MARFDPNTYPDRLAFEAHARRVRAEELAREAGTAGAWLRARLQKMKYLCAIGSTVAGSQVSSSPSARTS